LRKEGCKFSEVNKKKIRKEYEKKVRTSRVSEEVFEQLKKKI